MKALCEELDSVDTRRGHVGVQLKPLDALLRHDEQQMIEALKRLLLPLFPSHIM